MKKRALILVALVLAVLGVLASRPPRAWSDVTTGMSRQDVYARLGQPAFSSEKGFAFWRKDLLVGKWEFSAAFHADDSVEVFGYRWRWNF
ncbi:MAG TPA: hypothetical protein VMJ12_06505 [Candidatus Acidoferrales bacterium]|nr:hypothetical protein [Candidatus Acidoferrales bacterium]